MASKFSEKASPAVQVINDDVSSSGASLQAQKPKFAFDDPKIQEEVRRAVRKMDFLILPVMSMFYFLSFLDRANIGNARVAGLQKSLHMTDYQFSICVTITYVPYILAEIPSNLLLRKVGPNIGMPVILTAWGIIVTLQGLVTSFAGLAIARAFLGLMEGPMFPGIVLYLSGFYTREELSLRVAFFFSAASLSGAFSGLLAAAISNMGGIGGKPAWAWIFFLEGLFTIVVGVISFWFVPKTPRHSRYLSDRQKDLIMARLHHEQPFTSPLDTFSWKYVIQSLKSVHVWILFVVYFMGGTNLYGLALFLPSIIKQLGHSANRTQLLSVGPFAAGFFVTLCASWASDRVNVRFIPLCAILVLAVVGYAMSIGSASKDVLYASLYLIVPPIYGAVPIISAWIANNSEPHYTRATSIGIGFVATNMGGILSTWLYPSKNGPRFHKTTVMNLVFTLAMMGLACVNALYLTYRNKQKKANRAQILEPYIDSKEHDGGLQAWIDLGDRHPDFKYII